MLNNGCGMLDNTSLNQYYQAATCKTAHEAPPPVAGVRADSSEHIPTNALVAVLGKAVFIVSALHIRAPC